MRKGWLSKWTGSKADGAVPALAARPLVIARAGLCCAVGYHLDAAACAIRANMDHFQESDFVDRTGGQILAGRLPDDDCWGPARMSRWIAAAIEDCLNGAQGVDPALCALIVLAPEATRPDMRTDPYWDIITGAAALIGVTFHESSRILPLGPAGLAQALSQASQLLSTEGVQHVLLVAGDSLLDARAIGLYLSQERLLIPGNRDGFIPGEAAGALLLRASPALPGDVVIGGWGDATEAARFDTTEVPNRAMGLTAAVRQACERAGVAPTDLAFRASDQNGEAFFAREGSHAFARLRAGADRIEHLTMADKIAYVGAASGVAALAYLSHVMPTPSQSPGDLGIVHTANDDGLRCGVVVALHRE